MNEHSDSLWRFSLCFTLMLLIAEMFYVFHWLLKGRLVNYNETLRSLISLASSRLCKLRLNFLNSSSMVFLYHLSLRAATTTAWWEKEWGCWIIRKLQFINHLTLRDFQHLHSDDDYAGVVAFSPASMCCGDVTPVGIAHWACWGLTTSGW